MCPASKAGEKSVKLSAEFVNAKERAVRKPSRSSKKFIRERRFWSCLQARLLPAEVAPQLSGGRLPRNQKYRCVGFWRSEREQHSAIPHFLKRDLFRELQSSAERGPLADVGSLRCDNSGEASVDDPFAQLFFRSEIETQGQLPGAIAANALWQRRLQNAESARVAYVCRR
jgi:hypothetical protein